MGKEMGREEGAQMGTCPQRRSLQTFCTSVVLVGAIQLAQLPEVSGEGQATPAYMQLAHHLRAAFCLFLPTHFLI